MAFRNSLIQSFYFTVAVNAVGGVLLSLSCFVFLQVETISAIVYKYGLIAELIGNTKVTHHANTDEGSSITLACTKIPIAIIGNQQQKSVATMAVTLAVSLICCCIS